MKKVKNKKDRAVSFFWLKKASNIKQIKTKTTTLMIVVNNKLFFILLVSKK